jgi:hypothetical protein
MIHQSDGVFLRDVLHDPDNRKAWQKHGSEIVFEEIDIDVRFGVVFQH